MSWYGEKDVMGLIENIGEWKQMTKGFIKSQSSTMSSMEEPLRAAFFSPVISRPDKGIYSLDRGSSDLGSTLRIRK